MQDHPIVFTGKPTYVARKLEEMKRYGYRTISEHRHPGGNITIKMELKNERTNQSIV